MSKDADRVREYKKSGKLIHNGVDYARVIATRAYDNSIKNILRETMRLCSYQFKFKLKSTKNSNVLFMYSYRGKGRGDFDKIFDGAVGYASDAGIKFDVYESEYIFSIKNIFKIFSAIRFYVKFIKARIENPFYVAVLVAQFTEFETAFRKLLEDKSYKACVTFCDAHGVENMMAQLACTKGIKTATLQHGQYRILPKDGEVADVESYENFISNYLFAWGEVTANEFAKVGIDRNRIIPVGAIKSFSFNKIANEHKKLGVFGVCLCGNVYEKSNLAMIELANSISEKYGLKYILRMHPKNDEKFYLNKCNSKFLVKGIKKIENYEYANLVDFSVLHMTGVFVELLSINSPMFIYSDKYMADVFKIKDATFSNLNEFSEIYAQFVIFEDKFKKHQYEMYGRFNNCLHIENNYKEAYKKLLLCES